MLTSFNEGNSILSNGIRRLPGSRVPGYSICETGTESSVGNGAYRRDLEVVPVKFFKKMTGTDDIWEIRVQSGNNIFRILGFVEENNLVVLNHAFQKKPQKTPKKVVRLLKLEKRIIS